MFGIPATRIAELSRPEYSQELAEYARLEFPHEDARSVLGQALAADRAAKALVRKRFRLFRRPARRPEPVPANA